MTALFWLAEIDDECEGADEREPCPLPTFWSSSILTPSSQFPVPSSQLPAPLARFSTTRNCGGGGAREGWKGGD